MKFFEHCDEIWHVGDIGSIEVLEKLQKFLPTRAVFGNIDGQEIRTLLPLEQSFTIEGIPVFMTHIGGYPGKYAPGVIQKLRTKRPKVFISGHSHILKVMYDKKLNLLHINPGAAGKQGFHQVRTLVRFVIDGSEIKDLEIKEIPLSE